MYNVSGMWRTKLPGGFTIVEMLVSIGVMAVISGGIIAAIGPGPRKSARDGTRRAHIEAIRSALEIYRNDKRGYPLATGWDTALTGGGYITAVPTDPQTASAYTYTPSVCGSTVCSRYQICATMERPVTTYCMNNP